MLAALASGTGGEPCPEFVVALYRFKEGFAMSGCVQRLQGDVAAAAASIGRGSGTGFQ